MRWPQLNQGAQGAKQRPDTLGTRATAWALALAARYQSRLGAGPPADLTLLQLLAPAPLAPLVRLQLLVAPHLSLRAPLSHGPATPIVTAAGAQLPIKLAAVGAPMTHQLDPASAPPLTPAALPAAAQTERRLGQRAERLVSPRLARGEQPALALPGMAAPPLPHSASAALAAQPLPTGQSWAGSPREAADSLDATIVDRMRAEPAAAAPLDLERLTEQVIRGIDRRILARRERLGKG